AEFVHDLGPELLRAFGQHADGLMAVSGSRWISRASSVQRTLLPGTGWRPSLEQGLAALGRRTPARDTSVLQALDDARIGGASRARTFGFVESFHAAPAAAISAAAVGQNGPEGPAGG